MPYAIIKTGGKQYRVAPGDVIRVESMSGDVGSDVEFPEVLLRQTDSGLEVGTPLLSDTRVSGKILEHGRGKKILIFKKKRRKNYRRHAGHRQNYTAVQVTSIG